MTQSRQSCAAPQRWGSDHKHDTLVEDSPRQTRSSFSSIRENESDVSQAFTFSRTSAYLINDEAVDENQQSASDMTLPLPSHTGSLMVESGGALEPGEAPLERLPTELLWSIVNLLVLDVPSQGIHKRNEDLMNLLVTSRTMHAATVDSLHRNITIPHSRIFRKILVHVSANPDLGHIVRRIDFSHFNPSHLFTTASERAQAQDLTADKLLRCLQLTPGLREFLGQEYVEDDLDGPVLRKLFLGLERVEALDFCGCSSKRFRQSFTSILTPDWPMQLTIKRLSLHKCLTLPGTIFEAILPRLTKLTHLDVAGTNITDRALMSIPGTAALSHLNLAKCRRLSTRGVIDFLRNHTAVSDSLVFLSLATDARCHQLLDVDDMTELLAVLNNLPPKLRSLSLGGSKMAAAHVDLFRPLTKNLEELALGRGLGLADVNRLLEADKRSARPGDSHVEQDMQWVPHSLKYLDLSELCLGAGGEGFDLSYLYSSTCAILKAASEPLEVVEVAQNVYRRLSKSTALQRGGWRTSELGHRHWLVRDHPMARKSDRMRGWKMGAENWGMRKIAVAVAEVGGMYGSFMFSRKL